MMVDVNRSQSAESPANPKRWSVILVVVVLTAIVLVGAVILLESRDDDAQPQRARSADTAVATD